MIRKRDDSFKPSTDGYTWGGNPCVRCGDGFVGESHPCYYCGVSMWDDKDLANERFEVCEKCGFAVCPSCKICWCNAEQEVKEALVYLRNKYCCNASNFRDGIKGDEEYLRIVKHFADALNYCRERRVNVKPTPGEEGRGFSITVS